MIRVLVVDDHRLLRDGVRLPLETVEGVTVAAEAHDGQQALVMIGRCVPDVVPTDARMPGMDGVDLVAACRARYPQLPVLVLTTFDDEDVVHGALDAGAAGFLLEDVSPETLAEAITAVTRGEMAIDPWVVRAALRPPSRVSADPLAALTAPSAWSPPTWPRAGATGRSPGPRSSPRARWRTTSPLDRSTLAWRPWASARAAGSW